MSGLSHVFLIALLEILLYFLYLTKIEEAESEKFITQLAEDIKKKCDDLPYNINIDTAEYDFIKNKIEEGENEEKKKKEEKNKKYYWYGFFIILFIFLSLIAVYLFFKPSNQKWLDLNMWKEIVRDVFVTVFFVAIFEIIFITFIVTKYNISSSEAAKLAIMKSVTEPGACFNVNENSKSSLPFIKKIINDI